MGGTRGRTAHTAAPIVLAQCPPPQIMAPENKSIMLHWFSIIRVTKSDLSAPKIRQQKSPARGRANGKIGHKKGAPIKAPQS